MFKNKTLWQTLLNVGLIVMIIVSAILIYLQGLEWLEHGTNEWRTTERYIKNMIQALFSGGIAALYLWLTNKFQRRNESFGLLILDIVLIAMIIGGETTMINLTVTKLMGLYSAGSSYWFDLLNAFGFVLFPGISWYVLVRKSILKIEE